MSPCPSAALRRCTAARGLLFALLLPLAFARPASADDASSAAPAAEPVVAPAPAPDASSSRGPVGLGVLLGQPVGLSFKIFVAPDHAFQLGLGYDLVFRDAAFVTFDWVWHPVAIADTRTFELTWHVGLGGALGVWPVGHDYDCLPPDPLQPALAQVCRTAWVQPGARVPLGFDLRFHEIPLELYVEFAPGAFFYPMVEFLGQGGFGGRWYF